jgi:hypothetical protein
VALVVEVDDFGALHNDNAEDLRAIERTPSRGRDGVWATIQRRGIPWEASPLTRRGTCCGDVVGEASPSLRAGG